MTATYNKSGHNPVRTDLIKHLVKELYQDQQGQQPAGPQRVQERRVEDRRQRNEKVLLDTRSTRSRRQEVSRRWGDNNHGNQHKVGIDYYV
ncbi:MAG: hypothetical protein OEZ33_02205 [Gammaproteobacteria bacterium]|nr:hypothetical protein [Gammaproteobacteria bacterium]MDH5776999.1 hypothetical protein [Gammaproteobacteria bacterium]